MTLATESLSRTISADLFEELVRAAGTAPSPDNNQPWAFRLREQAIEVLHVRSRAIASDVGDLFSWIAMGAAIENLVLAASEHSLTEEIEYHDRPLVTSADGERIATLRLNPGGSPDPLGRFIEGRITNRRLYQRKGLPPDDLQTLATSLRFENDRIDWITGRSDRTRLAQLVVTADRVRFEHRPFHEEFHRVLRFGERSARGRGDGLDLRTLEIPRAAWPILRWLRPWSRMSLANRFGMSRLFARYSFKQVVRSGAVGLLTTSDDSDRGRLEAGRDFQRIWLAATCRGLAFQPLGSLPIFLARLEQEGSKAFLPHHAAALRQVVGPFQHLFPSAEHRMPVMLFRIGHSKPPSARSYRYSVRQIEISDETATGEQRASETAL